MKNYLLILCLLFSVAAQSQPGNALDLNSQSSENFVALPGEVYFNDDTFTIEVWVYLRDYASMSRLIDFGNGRGVDNVLLIASEGNGFPICHTYAKPASSGVQSTQQIPLNRWTHIAYVRNGSTGSFYTNGVLSGSATVNATPQNTTRSNCYIGRSNWSNDPYLNGKIDELRIWSVARTQAEIQAGMLIEVSTNAPGLQNYFRFSTDDGSSTVDDEGPANKDGIVYDYYNYDMDDYVKGGVNNWAESYAMVVPSTPISTYLSQTGFTATWSAPLVGAVDSYVLDYSTDENFSSFTTVDNITSTNTDINGLIPGTSYYWRVRANKGTVAGAGCYTRTSQYNFLTWTGNTSSDWNTPGNWNPLTIPIPGSSVIIPDVANDPVIAASVGASCNDLTIENNAALTVQPGGSLITNGIVSGNISIQREVEGSTNLSLKKYHLVSVPLAISNESQTSLFTGSYLYEYLPATNEWNGMGSTTTTGLDETVGYMIYYPNTSTTYTFTGVPNTGIFAPSVTYPGNADDLNFALVPNPYPSNIDWNAATGWTKTNIGTSIWFYNNGNYGVWDGTSGTNGASRYIAVGQAFFVQTTAADPAMAMDNGIRTHTVATFLKSGNPLASQLRVRAEANTMSDELLVGFGETTNNAYNASEDALKLQGAATAPQLCTQADNTKLSINNLAAINSGMVVPMNFETEFEGDVTLTFSQMESFPANLSIKLKDNLTSQLINLRKLTTYTFTHLQSNSSKRFELLFGSATGIDESQTTDDNIWISGKTVTISSPTLVGENALIEVYNAAGQNLFAKEVVLSNLTTFDLNVQGFVIVKLTSGQTVLTTKGILLK